jgi:hypothetical protein
MDILRRGPDAPVQFQTQGWRARFLKISADRNAHLPVLARRIRGNTWRCLGPSSTHECKPRGHCVHIQLLAEGIPQKHWPQQHEEDQQWQQAEDEQEEGGQHGPAQQQRQEQEREQQQEQQRQGAAATPPVPEQQQDQQRQGAAAAPPVAELQRDQQRERAVAAPPVAEQQREQQQEQQRQRAAAAPPMAEQQQEQQQEQEQQRQGADGAPPVAEQLPGATELQRNGEGWRAQAALKAAWDPREPLPMVVDVPTLDASVEAEVSDGGAEVPAEGIFVILTPSTAHKRMPHWVGAYPQGGVAVHLRHPQQQQRGQHVRLHGQGDAAHGLEQG